MGSVGNFFIEVTKELLYNIVYEAKEIRYNVLSNKFQDKTGHRPMDFFGWRIKQNWFKFIKAIPGVQGKKKISLCNDNDVVDDENHYKMFNTTYFNDNEGQITTNSVARYRETLLIYCCQMMKNMFFHLSGCKDAAGNTPLHLIAALPGITYDCDTLVKYLLQAGVDPSATNEDGQTFLHVMFGRYKAEMQAGTLWFTYEPVATTKWFTEDRVKLLDLLSKELTEAKMSSLGKAQDKHGNTVLHEYALASPIEERDLGESQIWQQFGARLIRLPNNNGEIPLHYAFNYDVFKSLVHANEACRRTRNDNEDNPFLFILKYSAELAFPGIYALEKFTNKRYNMPNDKRNLYKAIRLLQNLMKLFEEFSNQYDTAWIPDSDGNVAINIILVAIRLASCSLDEHVVLSLISINDNAKLRELRLLLVELCSTIVRCARSSDMKRKNGSGQNFLHVLLDISEHNDLVITTEILQCLEILLKHVDVNAADSKGCTPLDIIYKHYDKIPSLYERCAELLVEKGGTVRNQTRKLRSCPRRHFHTAKDLTDPNTQVTVVEKYRYSNQHPIGTGAFSNIFVAIKDEKVTCGSGEIQCRAYALKRLDKATINPQEIKRESSTLLSISGKCESIINCYELIEDPFFQYLCLDLMDGDLNEFVINNDANKILKEDPATCVQATKEIIIGLTFLHEANEKFIHRDLKPGNILYTTDPSLHFKIADFGLTKNMSIFSTMTSTRGSGVAMAPGTRCWMAPELVSMRSREHTQQSDIFSLGLVLHYLLTMGKHPFATETEERAHVIERNIEEMQISIDKNLHPEAINFLQSLLVNNPSERPPASCLTQHPFLWSEKKKNEFLGAVGDQPEAVNPARHVNSDLEKYLQMTTTGQTKMSWHSSIEKLFEEMTKAWKQKKYRTDKLIDLIRFIRNAYSHKQEKSLGFQQVLDTNIFLRVYPSLVLDVLSVVQQLNLNSRSNICEVLRSDT